MSKIIELQLREINSIGGGVSPEDREEIKARNRAVDKILATAFSVIGTSLLIAVVRKEANNKQSQDSYSASVAIGFASAGAWFFAYNAYRYLCFKFRSDIAEKSENKK